ncbi:9924_t:CDS:2 [Acaulospora morrowiae]|uniref:DASH complex subunit DUO1 n=1 Tax=Acaulospora morrowiae TaxID=94023 RepID=A0A9N9DPR3_9GLOM|nr:9924_t:CDS:2 [Acaulospora morrowiae]
MTSQALTSPTLQDQEFPDNSILNDSVLWFGDHEVSTTPRPFNIDGEHSQQICNEFDSILCSPGSCFESILPDNLTQDNNSVYESALRKELETLRKTNETFSKINNNMDQANENLQQFSNTVDQTDQLLDIWINILSQSISTQQILSDPLWQGSTAEKIHILEQVRERERLEQLARLQQEQLERERLERERIESKKKEIEAREVSSELPRKGGMTLMKGKKSKSFNN